jgi:hypothetical protein
MTPDVAVVIVAAIAAWLADRIAQAVKADRDHRRATDARVSITRTKSIAQERDQ